MASPYTLTVLTCDQVELVELEQANNARARWRIQETAPPTPANPQAQAGDETPTVYRGRDAQVSGVVAIVNKSNCYMRVTSNDGLSFNNTSRDGYALFAVRKLGQSFTLISGFLSHAAVLSSFSYANLAVDIETGKHINMFGISDITCRGPGSGLSLGVYRRPDSRCNLTISGYYGQNNETHYLSSQAGKEAYVGSLAVKRVADDSCHFSIEQLYVFHTTISSVLSLYTRKCIYWFSWHCRIAQ